MVDDVRIQPGTHYGLHQTRVGRIDIAVLVLVIGRRDEIQIVEVLCELLLHLDEELERAIAEEVPLTEVTGLVTFEPFEFAEDINRENVVTFLFVGQVLLAQMRLLFLSHLEVESVFAEIQGDAYRENWIQAAEYGT